MPEDLSQAIPIDEPFPGETPTAEAETDDDAEPEGAIEVQPGRRMVDVSVVAAERRKAKEVTEKRIREAEVAPLQQKAQEADQLRAAVNELKPYADFLRQNPHLMQRPAPEPEENQIPDEQAAQYARRYELFDPTSGQPDIKRAKLIMADHRREAAHIAKQAAAEAVGPIQQMTAQQAQREQFAQMVHVLGADDILTPEQLAQQFVELGPDLTSRPEVAQVALERAIGKAYLARRGKKAPSQRPMFSESPGGNASMGTTLTENARKMGLTSADLKASEKTFTPGGVSPLGEW